MVFSKMSLLLLRILILRIPKTTLRWDNNQRNVVLDLFKA